MVVILLIVAAVLLLLIVAASKPDVFEVRRTTGIKASPEVVYGLINDFHQWPQWSPWEKMDPSMRRAYSGTPIGVGTIYDWQGNKKVGRGRMEILESRAAERILIKLDFFEPFEAHNTAEFTLQAEAGATQLTWRMYGPQPFLFKLMGVLFSMDKVVGKDFEAGLANLAAIAEHKG